MLLLKHASDELHTLVGDMALAGKSGIFPLHAFWHWEEVSFQAPHEPDAHEALDSVSKCHCLVGV